ncbi:lysosomal dipeptide transporter MFSD1-like [Arctopsyche grandis]|uniref:lysosomal dipeptide transporter MFSD1-like n=1 Tax=Arctopsyche grandis TaxID=121162 RepID=UPI00406D7C76
MDSSRDTLNERRTNIQQHNSSEEHIENGCCSRSVCNPNHTCYRYIALIFMCFLGTGSYFCYDNPGALQDKFKDDLKMTTTQFVLLYSIYSWPNVVLSFVGGFLIDRVFGLRIGAILYMGILLIGALLFAFGGYINTFWLMVVGRFIFGIGGESLAVAQNNYAVRWFKGKELNMVFGLQMSFARVGSTVNFIVMEPLYNWVATFTTGYQKIGTVLFFASLTCVLSLICALILTYMDKRADTKLSENSQHAEEPMNLSAIKDFGDTFWLLSVICVSYFVTIFPFIALVKIFFERKYDYDPQSANLVNSVVYIVATISSPFWGLLIDKTGRNLNWMIFSILTTFAAHGMLAFTFWNPFIGMVTLALSYSLLCITLWPSISLIIPESQLGTAFGICQSVQNLGLAVVPLICGIIVDKGGYFMLELFFLGCLIVSLITTVCVVVVDYSQKGILNMKPSDRAIYLLQQNDTTPLIQDESLSNTLDVTRDHIQHSNSDRIRSRYLSKIGTHPAI